MLSGLRSTPQNFNIAAGRDTIIYGASDGTALHFYANSFKDASGNIITSGTIDIQLTEMYKPGEMICNRTTTITNDGQLLQSGGEINITASMNGQEVYANKYGIGFKQSAPSSLNMQLFYGNTNNTDSVTMWSADDVTKNGVTANGTTPDTSRSSYYYYFDSCPHLSQTNCDAVYLPGSTQKTDVALVLPDGSFNQRNTEVFLILPSLKLSIFMNEYDQSTNTIHLDESSVGLPIGLNFELAVITYKNDTYYFYETSGTITKGMTINAAMGAETLSDIKARLAGF